MPLKRTKNDISLTFKQAEEIGIWKSKDPIRTFFHMLPLFTLVPAIPVGKAMSLPRGVNHSAGITSNGSRL